MGVVEIQPLKQTRPGPECWPTLWAGRDWIRASRRGACGDLLHASPVPPPKSPETTMSLAIAALAVLGALLVGAVLDGSPRTGPRLEGYLSR
jgi:hypothetical protein